MTPFATPRNRQAGAALYVSLIMLILMALIGIVAMQVASLQERMSANYHTANEAFQNAEDEARTQEDDLQAQVDAGISPVTDIPPLACQQVFDPLEHTGADPHVRRLDLCFSWGALDVPSDESERTDQIYEVTAYSRDRRLLPTSEAIVDTVFIP